MKFSEKQKRLPVLKTGNQSNTLVFFGFGFI